MTSTAETAAEVTHTGKSLHRCMTGVRISRVVSVRAPTSPEPNCRAIAHASRQLGRLGQVEPRPGLLDVLPSEINVLARVLVGAEEWKAI